MTKLNCSEQPVYGIAERTTEICQASMCRLCFKNKYLVSIGSDPQFTDQLASCLHQKSSSDSKNLPEFVCGECYQLVEVLSQFKARCNRASKIMKRYIRRGGLFPGHDSLDEARSRRADKRVVSSGKGSDQPSAKRRRTKETIVEDGNCDIVCEDLNVTNFNVISKISEAVSEEYNPKQLAAKFADLFGNGVDIDLPGLKLILAATPPISPSEQADMSCYYTKDDDASISTSFMPAISDNFTYNPWIEALNDEALYSIKLNQLMESLRPDITCRSYTSYEESYVDMQ